MNRKIISSIVLLPFLMFEVLTFLLPVTAIEWTNDISLTNTTTANEFYSAITQTSDGKIWLVWWQLNTHDIFYKVFDGGYWSSEVPLITDPKYDITPSIMQADDGKIWIVWSSDRMGNYELFYRVSSDNGVSWSPDKQLTFDLKTDSNPSIVQTLDGKIWIFWASERTGQYEIFYKFSADNGVSWSGDTQLTFDSKNANHEPSATPTKDGKIWISWSKNGDIYYKIFNGTTWSAETPLTTHPAWDGQSRIMQAKNERIWVVWSSDRITNETNDIFYKILDGASWSDDIRLTTALEDDLTPSIMQAADGTIWVVWSSRRIMSQLDLYYRIGTELHDVAVRSISTYMSHETFAYRGEMINLQVEVENQGEGKETFEVKGYVNSTLIGSRTLSLDSGKSYVLIFAWNTSKAKPGKYFPSAVAVAVEGEKDKSDNSLTCNSFEVRIIGDICGWYDGVLKPIPDRRVNLDDFMVAVANFGTSSPTWNPVWGPASDMTEDGVVDIDDIMTIGLHYGET